MSNSLKSQEHLPLRPQDALTSSHLSLCIFTGMRFHVKKKRDESPIYLRALVLVKAANRDSRVQLCDTKSSIPISRKVYKDSGRRENQS